jgi:hypothetical protein
MRNSCSSGYCDRNPMSAPTSTRPAVISSTVQRCPSLPLYPTAVSREVVVDNKPNSTASVTGILILKLKLCLIILLICQTPIFSAVRAVKSLRTGNNCSTLRSTSLLAPFLCGYLQRYGGCTKHLSSAAPPPRKSFGLSATASIRTSCPPPHNFLMAS